MFTHITKVMIYNFSLHIKRIHIELKIPEKKVCVGVLHTFFSG